MKIHCKQTALLLIGGMVLLPFTACDTMSKTGIMATSTGGGAALGGVIGNLVGGDTKSTLIGTAIGAAAGLVIGHVWSESIVKDRNSYANKQDFVRDNRKQLDSRIKEANKSNRQISSQIANCKKQKKAVSKKDKDQQRAVMTKNIELMDKDIKTAKMATKDASGAELDELRTKINILSAEKREMEQNRKELASLQTI